MVVIQRHAKHGAREHGLDVAFDFNMFFFHRLTLTRKGRELSRRQHPSHALKWAYLQKNRGPDNRASNDFVSAGLIPVAATTPAATAAATIAAAATTATAAATTAATATARTLFAWTRDVDREGATAQ